MTTPTGQISLNDVNVELGLSGTTTISLNQTNVRTLAGVASGQISMNDLRGKSNRATATYTFSANTANASLNITTLSGYSAGNTDVTITINSGIYVYATSTANAGLTLTGGTTGDTVTIVNNGYIMGMGGNGASDRVAQGGSTAGGTALSLGFNTTIDNTNASAYIGGGGGGGAGAGSFGAGMANAGGGGGAGGGIGLLYQQSPTQASPGTAGSNGNTFSSTNAVSGGCGGRVFPGVGGTAPLATGTSGMLAAGRGGTGGGSGAARAYANYSAASTGGGGGGWGANGGNGYWAQSSGNMYGGVGGSSNSAGGNGTVLSSAASGSAGGKAVALNGKLVTWVSGNTTRVWGAVS